MSIETFLLERSLKTNFLCLCMKLDVEVQLNVGMCLIERLKVVETKTIKWTLTVAFEDHSPLSSLPIMGGGGQKGRTCS